MSAHPPSQPRVDGTRLPAPAEPGSDAWLSLDARRQIAVRVQLDLELEPEADPHAIDPGELEPGD
jgi:hypothetical protein